MMIGNDNNNGIFTNVPTIKNNDNDIVVEFMQIISVITINESLMNINERL